MRALIILVLVVTANSAEAQNKKTYLWFEPQVSAEKGGEYFGTISLGQKFSPRLGLFFQTAHGNLWGETTVGPSFSITKELEVGVGVGVEHYTPRLPRLRLNNYYDHERTGSFFYTQVDFGKTGNWVWVDGARMFKEVFGIGGLIQMPGGGAGPKLEFRPDEHLALWIAPVYDWQEKTNRTIFGIKFMFDW